MSSPRLSHQILDDDRVLISCVGRMMLVYVPAAEARRFAWALLADLDPAEADFLGYTPPTMVSRNGVLKERERKVGPWQRIEVLDAIKRGSTTAPKISMRLGLNQMQVSVQLNKLCRIGHVRKITIGRSYHPGTWGLTFAGVEFLEGYQDDEVAQ